MDVLEPALILLHFSRLLLELRKTFQMKVQTATLVASTISAVTLAACLVAMFSIYTDVASFWIELEQELGSFRVSALSKNSRSHVLQDIVLGVNISSCGFYPDFYENKLFLRCPEK